MKSYYYSATCVNALSDYAHCSLQTQKEATKTAQGKYRFENFARTYGIKVKASRADYL